MRIGLQHLMERANSWQNPYKNWEIFKDGIYHPFKVFQKAEKGWARQESLNKQFYLIAM